MGPFSSHSCSSSENNFTFSSINEDNASRFSKDHNHGKRKMPEFIDFLSLSDKYDVQGSVSSIAVTENCSFNHEDDQISTTLKLFDRPCIQDDHDVKMKQVLISVSERKTIPELIDFNWSCANNDDQKKPDPEQESSKLITSMELELNLGFFNGPNSKKRKIESTSSNEPTRPIPMHVDQQALVRDEDHWKIRKVLKKSDINGSSRLLLSKGLVRNYILPHLIDNEALLVDTEGANIRIWDVDTRSEHELVLITWKGTGSYVLKKNWTKDFVKRRGLKENNEIGLRWDDRSSRIEFTLFNGDN